MSSGSAPPIPARASILTGIYTGDGADNRNINIAIDLAAKDNAYVIIKGAAAYEGRHRIEYAQGDLTMNFVLSGDEANQIQLFNSTGFQIGSNDRVNSNGIVYRYIVLWLEG